MSSKEVEEPHFGHSQLFDERLSVVLLMPMAIAIIAL